MQFQNDYTRRSLLQYVPETGTAAPERRGSRKSSGQRPEVSRRAPPRRRSCRLRGRAPRRSFPRPTVSSRRRQCFRPGDTRFRPPPGRRAAINRTHSTLRSVLWRPAAGWPKAPPEPDNPRISGRGDGFQRSNRQPLPGILKFRVAWTIFVPRMQRNRTIRAHEMITESCVGN